MKSQLTQVSNYISGVVIEARISDGVVTFRVPGKHLPSFLKLFSQKVLVKWKNGLYLCTVSGSAMEAIDRAETWITKRRLNGKGNESPGELRDPGAVESCDAV